MYVVKEFKNERAKKLVRVALGLEYGFETSTSEQVVSDVAHDLGVEIEITEGEPK